MRRVSTTVLLAAAGLLIALAVSRAVRGGLWGTSRPASIRYTIVAGDTAAGVGSLFAVDPVIIAGRAGTPDVRDQLPAGDQIDIDPASVWERMSHGTFAANESLVQMTARAMGVEPALALAVAWEESRLDQSARSPTGAVGIMQVEPDTGRLAARDLGRPIDVRRAADDVVAGIFWLRTLLTSYHGDRSSALAAYYEGPGNLAREGYLQGTYAYVAHGLAVRRALLAANGALGS